VLVTGASGFVGSHLVPRLEAAGCRVTPTDRELDVTDLDAVERRIAQLSPDVVFHLAAQSSPALSIREPELTYRVNFVGTRAVLEATRRSAPSARVIFVSSADLYGSAEPGAAPFDESSPLRPRSPYSRSKAAADLLAGTFAERGLDVVRVRPFNHTGPGQSDVFVLSSFARQIASIAAGISEPVLRVGNLDSVRDFLDIDDVMNAYLELLAPTVTPGVYNVARGVGVRIGDALDELCSLAGISPRVEVEPDFFRPTDIAVGRAARLERACGWTAQVPFRRTLERLLTDWRTRIDGA